MKYKYHSQHKYNRFLLGLGMDEYDGHRRITTGDSFKIIGGSEQTHENMQETTLKLVENLKKRGKSIITASDEEFYDTALKIGLKIIDPLNN